MKGKIYTHDYAAEILELFEAVLEKHDIKIPSPEDDEREEDNGAPLYGSTYSELLDGVEDLLIGILDEAGIKDYVPDAFSSNF